MILAQVEVRSRQIGLTPSLEMNDTLKRNYEIGVRDGMQSVPQLVRAAATSLKERYTELLEKDRAE